MQRPEDRIGKKEELDTDWDPAVPSDLGSCGKLHTNKEELGIGRRRGKCV
jgi:hypothetical protein